MQRLHQDDLVGHVMDQEEWDVVSFPAIAEEDEIWPIVGPHGTKCFRRKAGDVLEPERESRETLVGIRRTLGEYNFASQYQQSPIPLGGNIIKTEWLRYYEPAELPKRFSCVLQSWDTANKSGELNDFSVCTTWGVVRDYYYLLDVFRKRLNFPDLKRAMLEEARRHNVDIVLIEDKASGTQLIQDLPFEGLYNVTPYAPLPGTDKIVRLYAQSAEFENGRVLLPRNAPWCDEYVREVTGFPGVKHDDQVDSTTQALAHLKEYRSSGARVWAYL